MCFKLGFKPGINKPGYPLKSGNNFFSGFQVLCDPEKPGHTPETCFQWVCSKCVTRFKTQPETHPKFCFTLPAPKKSLKKPFFGKIPKKWKNPTQKNVFFFT
jgi:hypothetical protein